MQFALDQLRPAREARGWTQQELADAVADAAWQQNRQRVGINADMISKWERGAKSPSSMYRRLLEHALGITARDFDATAASPHSARTPAERETALAVMGRVARLTAPSASDSYLDAVGWLVDAIVDSYERSGPVQLVSQVAKERHQIDGLLQRAHSPTRQARLFTLAGRLSGLLAYMSVNMGRLRLADAYCEEAFALAEYAGDRDLQAWSRGTASLCAYYRGDYAAALAQATDGQRYAAGGPQTIRLAVNGQARALARLGDQAGARQAIDHGYAVASRFQTDTGITPCISFGTYGGARTAANAATAFVDLGDRAMVEQHAASALPACEASESVWSQSLVRLDVARSLIQGHRPDVERAALLATEALTISSGRPITSVIQRTKDFARAASSFGAIPELGALEDALSAATSRA